MMDPDKLNNKHKLVIDAYFKNGFNGSKAYCSIYKTKRPNTASVNFHNMMKRDPVIKYYNEKLEEYKETLKLDKDKLIERQMKLDNMFMQYLELTTKIELTDEEKILFERFYMLFGKVDLQKNRDMLHKLGGYYEPEKSEVEHKGIIINYKKPTNLEKPESDEE